MHLEDYSYNAVLKCQDVNTMLHHALPLEEATKIIAHPDHLRLAKAIGEGRVPADLLNT